MAEIKLLRFLLMKEKSGVKQKFLLIIGFTHSLHANFLMPEKRCNNFKVRKDLKHSKIFSYRRKRL
ncbi:MAG: hypothetical protein A2499_03090 [Stygiobacter sp. RIFOXYC12_FULL_38_8]|nr:MAG: hypothetical protein A2279_09035 [Stygiobacter sp. RIFOXYA12_FULL_38_9]OGV06639.1 MAG: hypothetical protein A2299_01485 [Stygiobacter sp. RIFOXYB2_FULL_37_11]OGV11503.1 MAG: hypothetical protein A2237_05465 [Stygiobacter sp. RIFOXYA2_FULL_38_8]OGV15023.1 MAG: hypothetical protein A2440_06650 [Stygiobacter sp. RIFOXYC2_FULL_38_25]OGV22097.1 MAG: hypothetical protein A2499_03090 [Stygiobacter sp. RIFOXYC12_FULL_38_8]OGV79597.1 MAG: hypothetical protein A2X65_18730 [Stygiobacter sp. GWF2_